MQGAGDEVDGRGGSELLEAPVKISGPLGDQLSSITRRIQLQREAERIQHRSVTHRRWGRERGWNVREGGREGGVGGSLVRKRDEIGKGVSQNK